MNRQNKTQWFFSLLLLIVLLLAATAACGKSGADNAFPDRPRAGQTTQQKDRKQTETDFTFTEDKAGLDWPRQKMGGLPPLDATIVATVDGGDGYVVSFTDLSRKAAQKYVADLRKSGYSAALNSDTRETIMFYGSSDDDQFVMFIYDVETGAGTLSYNTES